MLYSVLAGAIMLMAAGALRVTDPKLLAEWGINEESADRLMDAFHVGSLMACAAGLAVFVGLDLYYLFGVVFVTLLLAAAVIAGFASQPLLASAVSGFAWRFTQPFNVGDKVTLAGKTGVVAAVGLCHTSLIAGGREVIYVPNVAIFAEALHNHSKSLSAAPAPGLRQVAVPLRLAPTADLDRAVSALERAALATQEFICKQNASDSIISSPDGGKTLAAFYKERHQSDLDQDQAKCPPEVLVCGQDVGGGHAVEVRFFCDETLADAVAHHGYLEAVKCLGRAPGTELK